jgi:hypothetical protein
MINALFVADLIYFPLFSLVPSYAIAECCFLFGLTLYSGLSIDGLELDWFVFFCLRMSIEVLLEVVAFDASRSAFSLPCILQCPGTYT